MHNEFRTAKIWPFPSMWSYGCEAFRQKINGVFAQAVKVCLYRTLSEAFCLQFYLTSAVKPSNKLTYMGSLADYSAADVTVTWL